jgi:hypothetical protein
VVTQAFNLFLGYYRGIGQSQYSQRWSKWLFQRYLQGVAVDGFQPQNLFRIALDKLFGTLNPPEEISHRPERLGTEKASKRVDKILCRYFSAVMELDSLSQSEGPDTTIP